MEKKPHRQYSPEEKVRILRLHLLEGKAVSDVAGRFKVHHLRADQSAGIGAFAFLAQKHESMFRPLYFLNKGVFSTTRTHAEFHSVSGSGFGDVSL